MQTFNQTDYYPRKRYNHRYNGTPMPLLRNLCLIFGVNVLLFAVYSEQAARPAPREAGRVQFNEVATASGITFRHENGASAEKYMFETFGSGVGVIDFENDGQPDL